jgi:hypothetical protein
MKPDPWESRPGRCLQALLLVPHGRLGRHRGAHLALRVAESPALRLGEPGACSRRAVTRQPIPRARWSRPAGAHRPARPPAATAPSAWPVASQRCLASGFRVVRGLKRPALRTGTAGSWRGSGPGGVQLRFGRLGLGSTRPGPDHDIRVVQSVTRQAYRFRVVWSLKRPALRTGTGGSWPGPGGVRLRRGLDRRCRAGHGPPGRSQAGLQWARAP